MWPFQAILSSHILLKHLTGVGSCRCGSVRLSCRHISCANIWRVSATINMALWVFVFTSEEPPASYLWLLCFATDDSFWCEFSTPFGNICSHLQSTCHWWRAFMRTEFLCISVLRVASGPRMKLASCKSALNPTVVYSTDRSKAVALVFVLLFVALWFSLRGGLFYILPCVILFLCFSVLLALRLSRLGKKELILVLFVHLLDLRLFSFVSVSSSSWCLGRAAVCDCGTPWTFLLLFLS